jgi:GNAT superfamily N-acetyltransferase
MITVRPAAPADLATLLRMVEEYWRFEDIAGFDTRRVGANLSRLLADGQLGRAWLAEADGEPAGYLLAVFMFSLEFGGICAEIDELFVLPHHRALGAGAALLDAVEAYCRAAHCPGIALQISSGNERAREFYRRRGYEKRDGFELMTKLFEES